jgi:hypothetical protein
MLPFVNYTEIVEHIESVYDSYGEDPPVELFPRWVAQTRIFNADHTRNTSSYMIAGDTVTERNTGMAPGFPIHKLGPKEMITTSDIASVLGVVEGDKIHAEVRAIALPI